MQGAARHTPGLALQTAANQGGAQGLACQVLHLHLQHGTAQHSTARHTGATAESSEDQTIPGCKPIRDNKMLAAPTYMQPWCSSTRQHTHTCNIPNTQLPAACGVGMEWSADASAHLLAQLLVDQVVAGTLVQVARVEQLGGLAAARRHSSMRRSKLTTSA